MKFANEKNAFRDWLIGQSSLYEDNLAEDDTLTEVEKRAAGNAVSSFTESVIQTLGQMNFYAVYCTDDLDGAVYGVYEDSEETVEAIWESKNPVFQLTRVFGTPIFEFGSVLSQQRYKKY